MIDDEVLGKIRDRLLDARFGESMMESAIDALVDAGAGAALDALCGGTVDLEHLLAVAPRTMFEEMLSYLQLRINAHAAGDEIAIISSPAMPVEEARKRFEACRALTEALVAHGLVRIEMHPESEFDKFTLHLVDEPHARPGAPDPLFAAALAQGGPRYPVCVRFAGDGLALSGARDATMTLWDLGTGRVVRTFHGHAEAVWSIAVAADGSRAVTASGDTTMRLWDLATGQCLRVFEGHTDPLRTVEIAPDGRLALTGGWDGSMRMWDLETGRCLHRYECNSGSRFSNEVPATLAAARALSHAPYSQHALWDLSSGECRTLIKFDPYPRIAALADDGRHALCHHSVGVNRHPVSRLVLWDLDELAPARTFAPFPGQSDDYSVFPQCLAISQCGRRAAAGYGSGDIHVWDLASGRHLRTLGGHAGRVNGIGFSRDGGTLLSASSDLAVRMWDVASGACLRVLHAERTTCDGGLAQPLLPTVRSDEVPASVLGHEPGRASVTLKAPAAGFA
jgi:hypothetical protein